MCARVENYVAIEAIVLECLVFNTSWTSKKECGYTLLSVKCGCLCESCCERVVDF